MRLTSISKKLMASRSRITSLLFDILTSSYTGSLHHYTIDPITQLCVHQDNVARLRVLLVEFRQAKTSELEFVQRAAILSAAAVIGVFSWSEFDGTFWVAKMMWRISLCLSIAALVSSAQQRMLETIPGDFWKARELSDGDVQRLLRLMLKRESAKAAEKKLRKKRVGGQRGEPSTPEEEDVERAVKRAGTTTREEPTVEEESHNRKMKPDPLLIWAWQCPVMLMNFSWISFIVGYALHILTPIIHLEVWSVECTSALTTIIVGAIVWMNFEVTGLLVRKAIPQAIGERSEQNNRSGDGTGVDVNISVPEGLNQGVRVDSAPQRRANSMII